MSNKTGIIILLGVITALAISHYIIDPRIKDLSIVLNIPGLILNYSFDPIADSCKAIGLILSILIGFNVSNLHKSSNQNILDDES
jgi:hypothetical protein